MERYFISIAPSEGFNAFSLLIPFQSSSQVLSLQKEISSRVAKRGLKCDDRDIELHLGGKDGPILDPDDILHDVILNSEKEIITVILSRVAKKPKQEAEHGLSPIASDADNDFVDKGVQIQVITPELARDHDNLNCIPLLRHGRKFPDHTTLKQIRLQIADHLGLPAEVVVQDPDRRECNCSLARQINERGTWVKLDCDNHGDGQGSLGTVSQCSFLVNGDRIRSASVCAICSESLLQHHHMNANGGCSSSIFMRTDTFCGHILHSSCVNASDPWRCPHSCQFATSAAALDRRTNEPDARCQKPDCSFILISQRSVVERISTDGTNWSAILLTLRQRLGQSLDRLKSIHQYGGVQSPDGEYDRMPVVSICSKSRHEESVRQEDHKTINRPSEGNQPIADKDIPLESGVAMHKSVVLDLHTAEGPIETEDSELTFEELGLADLAVNGVVQIYAVHRTADSKVTKDLGQNAIFQFSPAWEHPVAQSQRGVAMFLSSLRVLTHHMNAARMSEPGQDALLYVFDCLTRFRPAIRSLHILMAGKSPRPNESAALIQAVFEVLKEYIPTKLINGDFGRLLEGSRLLLDLIIEKARQVQLPDGKVLPYLSSFRTFDLRNYETMENIANPVQTATGLVETGFFESLRTGGIFSWRNGEEPISELELDPCTKRVVKLCGGTRPEVTIFRIDDLDSQSNYRGQSGVITLAEFTNLGFLNPLHSVQKLTVVPPSALSSSEAPVLTLDREGLLAVYVGKQPCANPGQDITIFRPTRGGETTIDVAIVTQLLAPILESRQSDGTHVFDSYGGKVQRLVLDPDEIIMFCLDCSMSMSESTDFDEINEDDNRSNSDTMSDVRCALEGNCNSSATLEDMKDYLSAHESFEDMLAIVTAVDDHGRLSVASKILLLVMRLVFEEFSHWRDELQRLERRATRAYVRQKIPIYTSKMDTLRRYLCGLLKFKEPLSEFIMFRAMGFKTVESNWQWRWGDKIPRVMKDPSTEGKEDNSDAAFSVPDEYLCPISRELIEDPVLAADENTYERSNIERWFQIRKSSPLTGLSLTSTELRRNGQLAVRIESWIRGDDLLNTQPNSSEHIQEPLSQEEYKIHFHSSRGSFHRLIPAQMTMRTLYELAYRGLKGRFSQLQLYLNNSRLLASNEPLSSTALANKSVVTVMATQDDGAGSTFNRSRDGAPDSEELCLVKVYRSHLIQSFSYWVSKETQCTVASILFRYWRKEFELDPSCDPEELSIWTDLDRQGDGHSSGNKLVYWERLDSLLNPETATGKLGYETVFVHDSDNESEAEPDSDTEDEWDDSDEDDEQDDSDKEDELRSRPLVLKVFLGKSGKSRRNNLTRLDVTKQMFETLVNRVLAYNFKAHMGLIRISSTAEILQSLTYVVENFRKTMSSMSARGDTALWDALALASDQLSEYAQKFPNAKKRIICLTDGLDTKSDRSCYDVAKNLIRRNVVVDSICLGNEDNEDLRTISYLTGGYKFAPGCLEEAMAICEMETVLSQLERPPVVSEASITKVSSLVWADTFHRATLKALPETVTRDVFPQRREHPNLRDQFVEILSLSKPNASSGTRRSNARTDSYLSNNRILSEIRNLSANPHAFYDVYVSESNTSFWKIVMEGPPESAYTGGTFILYLDMGPDYPAFPPKARFVTPIYHPNINRHGRICHSILDRNWTSDTTNSNVLNTIYSLLLVPEFSDPVNAVVTLNYHWDEVEFQSEVKEHIAKHATKSRVEWRAEILGE